MELKHESITLSSLVRRALNPTCSILICFSREGGGVLAPGFLRTLYRRVQGILRSLLTSVAKCRRSWVVGRGRGSWVVGRESWVWVWVNVAGKKMSSKKITIKKLKSKQCCKIHETKISEYIPVLLPLHAVSKTNKRTLWYKRALKRHLGEK